MSEGAPTMIDTFTPRHFLSNLPKMPTSASVVAAAMIAVGAEQGDHIAHSSYIAVNGKAACIQGALLAKLGYEFPAEGAVCGSAWSVAHTLGVKNVIATRGSQLYYALAAAQNVSDAELPWSLAAEMFADVLEREKTLDQVSGRIAREQDKTPRVPLHGGDEFTLQMQKFGAYAQQIADAMKTVTYSTKWTMPNVPAYEKVTLAWDTEPVLEKELVVA